eukprot:FR736005.1.p1 GENE.FR736005.1~~FR736005.1.p1  ORF type:complete len:273 (+),score=37.57 FR736005.1:44-820(+)
MVENAGKAFEHMMETMEAERKAASLPDSAAVDADLKAFDAALIAVVDGKRANFGLPPLAEAIAKPLLQRQKDETVQALATCAVANEGVMETLVTLNSQGVRYNIATTSGKPRVPTCVDAASLRPFFPPEQIHSGESDFDPPRFKPDPSVYLKAAAAVDRGPANCIAVEDSGSGVGSAANAEIGLIVGYVGATHIQDKDAHAQMLMAGKRSTSGRGAEVVIEDFLDLAPLVHAFECAKGSWLSKELLSSLRGRYWSTSS